MKKLITLITLIAVILSGSMVAYAQGPDKSPNLPPKRTAPSTAKSTTTVTVPANIKPVKSYVTTKGTNYKMPDAVKKTGDTYATSNSAILTVDKTTGRFKTIDDGIAYIIATNGSEKRYIKVTVGTGKAATQKATASTGKSALAPYANQVTVSDKSTLAVRCSGSGSQMYFMSKDLEKLGSIPESVFFEIEADARSKGYITHDINQRNLWFGEQFNLFRGLSSGGTEALKKQTEKDTSGYASEFVSLVANMRKEKGLPALEYGADIQELANTRAKELADNYSHTRPDGTTVVNEGCYEIITTSSTPGAAFSAFSNSKAHKNIMMTENRTTIAAGVYVTSNGNVYWAVLFGY